MPETPTPTPTTTETPGEKTFRRFYEGRLAARLMQAASMERNRNLLRRGARKMQDGTLNQPGDPTEEEPVNISIGDTIHYAPQPAAQPATAPPQRTPAAAPQSGLSTLGKIGAAAALLVSGAGAGAAIPWLLGAFQKQPPAAVQPAQGDDTWQTLRLSSPRPESKP